MSTIATEARQLRKSLRAAPNKGSLAHRQIAERRISDAILLAGRNDDAAAQKLADARFHAQHVLEA